MSDKNFKWIYVQSIQKVIYTISQKKPVNYLTGLENIFKTITCPRLAYTS